MNAERFTQKSIEALNGAQKLAVEYANQSMEPEHLLAALASQENGFIPQLLKRMGVDKALIRAGAVDGDEIRIVERAFEFEAGIAGEDEFDELNDYEPMELEEVFDDRLAYQDEASYLHHFEETDGEEAESE